MSLTKVSYSMINGSPFNVLDFGAVGDGVANDTAAIQNALNAAHDAGGHAVYVPAGIYSVTQLKMRNHTALYGDGWSSRIQLRAGSNQNLIVLWDTSTEWTLLSNLMIDGNRYNNSAGDAISYNNNGGTFTFFDPNHIIQDVLIYTAAGSGLVLSADCRESKIINVFCTGANGNGYYLACTDSTFVNCTSGSAGLTGWNILGPNNRITSCKSFGSGRLVAGGGFDGAGFRIAQPRQMMTACEAQDNGWHGFLFVNANNCSASALLADSNGNVTSGAAGIRLDNSSECVIQGGTLNRDGGTNQKYALGFANSPANNIINITSKDNALGSFIDAVGNNIVIINNSQMLSSSAPTLNINKSLAWQLTSDTQLSVYVRGSDGTSRSATLTLT